MSKVIAIVLVRLVILPHFNVNVLKQENSTSPAFPQNFQNIATPYSSLGKQQSGSAHQYSKRSEILPVYLHDNSTGEDEYGSLVQ